VASAEGALSLLESDPRAFDVIISDLRLPQLSGEELAERVREQYPHLAKRILLMSGFFRDQKDIPHFLQKPFTASKLYKALARLIRHAERDA
jgi:CheY-like chemotaxis protein